MTDLDSKILELEVHEARVFLAVSHVGDEITLKMAPDFTLGTMIGEKLLDFGLEIYGFRVEDNTHIEIGKDNALILQKEKTCYITCRRRKN